MAKPQIHVTGLMVYWFYSRSFILATNTFMRVVIIHRVAKVVSLWSHSHITAALTSVRCLLKMFV